MMSAVSLDGVLLLWKHESMQRHVALSVGLLLCAASGFSSAAAQSEPVDRPGRRVVAAAATDRVVRPRTVPPDPGRDAVVAFHRSLDGDGADASRRSRLARARRVADLDLVWGLE